MGIVSFLILSFIVACLYNVLSDTIGNLYLIGSMLMVSFAGVSYYNGYISRISNWFNVRRQRVKLILTLLEKLQTDVKDKRNTTPAFAINDNDMSASLTYERLEEKYILFVPYMRKYIAPMSQFKTELLRENKDPLNITQQPGIPYLVTADQLGGYAIRITNDETGKSYDYQYDKYPLYGEEVMDIE